MSETFKLENFKILEPQKYEGTVKSGRNAGKPYVKFVFMTDHEKTGDIEFSYFADPDKPENWPYDGVVVKEMAGERGTYQGNPQYNVKTILYSQHDTGKARATPTNGAEKNSPVWFCIAYAKDLEVARLIHLKPSDPIPDLSELASDVVTAGMLMYRDVMKNLERVEK